MRHGRAKQARRTLQFFERTIHIHPPYHIILDGTFVVAIIKYKFPLQERFDKLLQHATFHLHVCSGTLTELKTLQEQQQSNNKKGITNNDNNIFQQAIQWCTEHCEIIDESYISDAIKTTTDEISGKQRKMIKKLSVAANEIYRFIYFSNNNSNSTTQTINQKSNTIQRRYFCASQDDDLLDIIRYVGIVPVIRLARGSVLLLEQPSKYANKYAEYNERNKYKTTISESEQKLVNLVKQQEKQSKRQEQKQIEQKNQQQLSRKKPKAKGPNPLSCKKRKSADNKEKEHSSAQKRSKQK